MIVKCRPSSHSDDYTIIARYATPKQAERAFSGLQRFLIKLQNHKQTAGWNTSLDTDWHPAEAGINLQKNEVKFQVNTDGFLKQVALTLKRFKPKKIRSIEDHIEVRFSLKTPRGATVATLPFTLPDKDVQLVRKLVKMCGEPAIRNEGRKQFFDWKFVGQAAKICEEKEDIETESRKMEKKGRHYRWSVNYC